MAMHKLGNAIRARRGGLYFNSVKCQASLERLQKWLRVCTGHRWVRLNARP
jgi:hypothetical protein